jgi:hypothetical protein
MMHLLVNLLTLTRLKVMGFSVLKSNLIIEVHEGILQTNSSFLEILDIWHNKS